MAHEPAGPDDVERYHRVHLDLLRLALGAGDVSDAQTYRLLREALDGPRNGRQVLIETVMSAPVTKWATALAKHAGDLADTAPPHTRAELLPPLQQLERALTRDDFFAAAQAAVRMAETIFLRLESGSAAQTSASALFELARSPVVWSWRQLLEGVHNARTTPAQRAAQGNPRGPARRGPSAVTKWMNGHRWPPPGPSHPHRR